MLFRSFHGLQGVEVLNLTVEVQIRVNDAVVVQNRVKINEKRPTPRFHNKFLRELVPISVRYLFPDFELRLKTTAFKGAISDKVLYHIPMVLVLRSRAKRPLQKRLH